MKNTEVLFSLNNVAKHEFVEITIPKGSTQTRFPFPDIQNLRNSKMKGMELYTGDSLSHSITTGNIVLDISIKPIGYLTLMDYQGREVIKQLPILNLDTNGGFGVANLSGLGFARFKNLKINYPKSFVEFTNTIADPAQDRALVFSIYYEDLTEAERNEENTFRSRK